MKWGITDTDYPHVPMGGWAGTISEIQKDGLCLVRWSTETLAAIQPVFKHGCENDGLERERYWLGEDDLEPDEGGPLELEEPTEIVTKSLSHMGQDDRIRMIFGLTGNDPLPDVDDETLATYHGYLLTSLSFPFEAERTPESGHLFPHSHTVKVIGLGDPDREPMIDEQHGILCEARHQRHVVTVPLGELEVDKGKPNRQLVKDYCFWFWKNL